LNDDPEILASPDVPSELQPLPAPPPPRPRRIPNFGHTVVFFTVVIIVLLLTSVSVFALAMGLHLLGTETPEQLLREPRLLSMAASYLIAGAIVWAIFTYLWQQSFTGALHWNFAAARRRWVPLLVGGVVLSLAVQFLSNYLPIPKTLPIDDFFRTSADVWLVALFGTFLAPVFEELAFRGFLLPSLASAYDWLRGDRLRSNDDPMVAPAANHYQRWSAAALLVSCTLTSIAFALVHADQLAHAWAPLAVLFGVSLVLCVVRLWTQSLAASTLVHATYNATIFTILFFVTGGFRHLDKIR
jgi:uncharacterized protein